MRCPHTACHACLARGAAPDRFFMQVLSRTWDAPSGCSCKVQAAMAETAVTKAGSIVSCSNALLQRPGAPGFPAHTQLPGCAARGQAQQASRTWCRTWWRSSSMPCTWACQQRSDKAATTCRHAGQELKLCTAGSHHRGSC